VRCDDARVAERGLYESLVTEALKARLEADDRLVVDAPELRAAEAADRIALHLAQMIERAVGALPEDDRVAVGVALARRIVDVVVDATAKNELAPERPVEPARMLRALMGRLPDGRAEAVAAPLIPLLDTAWRSRVAGAAAKEAPGARIGSVILSLTVQSRDSRRSASTRFTRVRCASCERSCRTTASARNGA
jgi:hypothetical protein